MYLIISNIIHRISLLNRRGTCVDFQNLMKAVNILYSVSFIKPCFKFDRNHILQVSFSPHFFSQLVDNVDSWIAIVEIPVEWRMLV